MVVHYLEFYSIERFDKTKLGWMLLYAKQSQDRLLIKELIETFKDEIEKLNSKERNSVHERTGKNSN